MQIAIIAALGTNRAIGRNNHLLWHLPGDLPRFKQLTMGAPLIMGRKTFESIGRPLPGRLNIVVTRNPDYPVAGIERCNSVQAALACAEQEAGESGLCFIIGGGDLYAQTIDMADKLYLTEVDDAPADADTFFPDYSRFSEVVDSETHQANGLVYRYVERIRPHGECSTRD